MISGVNIDWREEKRSLVPTPELMIGVYDTLSDWQIDAILAGRMKAPGARHFGKPGGAAQHTSRANYRCSFCGKKGHARNTCVKR